MRFLVVGAGVIGQVYAGRLHEAGHEVTLLARPAQVADLVALGVRLETEGRLTKHRVSVRNQTPMETDFDYAFLAVRDEQSAAGLEAARQAGARREFPGCYRARPARLVGNACGVHHGSECRNFAPRWGQPGPGG